jgi:mannose-6-phosphate isomerase-like protein (cupin superfamily)
VNAKLVVLDMPAILKKFPLGRGPSKSNDLACATAGVSSLIQLSEPLPEHTHADADEFVYVIAGEGIATMGTRREPLGPSVFMMIPRDTAHAIIPNPKKPLQFISTRAGERCGAAAAESSRMEISESRR